jgi:protein-arginine kinase activator protein McsA
MPLICEMCGSNDLLKEDGVFVCKNCGTKYSVDEAKKMMVEGSVEITGTVDVSGTVKVDNTQLIERYLQNARRSREKGDWEEVEKYYNLVEQNQPHNIEAIFYSAFGRAKMSLVDDDIYKRQQIFNVLSNCVSIIDDNYDTAKEEQQKEIILSISADIKSLRFDSYVFTEWKGEYGNVIKTNKEETEIIFDILEQTFLEALLNIAQQHQLNYLYKLIIEHSHSLIYPGILCIKDTSRRLVFENIIIENSEKLLENCLSNNNSSDIDIELLEELRVDLCNPSFQYWYTKEAKEKVIFLDTKIYNILRQNYWDNHPEEYHNHLEKQKRIALLEKQLIELKEKRATLPAFDFTTKKEIRDQIDSLKAEINILK